MHPVSGGVTAPAGFEAAGMSAGLKPSGRPDLALIHSRTPASVAGVFTTNRVQAAPLRLTREHVADGAIRAVVVNAGNANACTGPRGEADALATAEAVAETLGVDVREVAVASTGVIGVPLDVERLTGAIPRLVDALEEHGSDAAANAILTTDTFAKSSAAAVIAGDVTYTVGAVGKGSGMIHPSMATMLAFVTTDAPLDAEACRAALAGANARTFDRITVDGDTSTNDMVLLMANGAAGGDPIGPGSEAFEAVAAAVEAVCDDIARMIVRDGEGATKSIEVRVTGAADEDGAVRAAKAIAGSPLFKCAMFGEDPNWGRVLAAAGAAGVEVDPDRMSVRFGDLLLAEEGRAAEFDRDEAAAELAGEDVLVTCDLGVGAAEASVFTCDLSYEYVRINAEYTT